MLWDPVMDNPPPAISFIILRRWDSQSPNSWWKSETQTCGNVSAVTFLNLKHGISQQLCLSLILSFCVAFYSVNPTTFPKSQQYISRGKEKRLEMRLFFLMILCMHYRESSREYRLHTPAFICFEYYFIWSIPKIGSQRNYYNSL